MRIAVLHDYLDKYGGGERVALTLAQAFGADIYTGFVDRENTFPEIRNCNVTEIAKPISNPAFRTIALMKAFAKLRLDYDAFIFSGTSSIAAVHNRPNIWYCHTPARYLYDLKDWFDANSGLAGRIGLGLLRRYTKPKDQAYARQFDRIVANSQNVKQRIERHYGIGPDAVIYPPTDVRAFRYRKSSGFYLSAARLDRLKRVDVIVRAFAEMPEKQLVVVSSGPELERIRALAHGHGNIEIRGWVSQHGYADLLSRCTATVYVPLHEDSGISPVEGMAAGKPCIAANEGGLKETIVHNKTGLLIDATVSGVQQAVQRMTEAKARAMRTACTKRAKLFSKENFIQGMKAQLTAVAHD